MIYFGLGFKTLVIGLFFYSLLPIVRNTYVGIREVDESVVEAGKGVGMTTFQLDGVDAIFATHMENYLPVGKLWHNDNYILGASDDLTIEITGSGGHAAFPQDAADVIAIGSQLVSNLQQIVSRKIDPMKSAVLTIGSFNAGQYPNIISQKAVLEGTVRTFDEQIRREIHAWVKQITEHTCKAFGAEFHIDYNFGYPATKMIQR